MWYNNLIIPILRSPLHGMLGPNFILITYQGQKSGKTYSLPVNILAILEESPNMLLVSSLRERSWWRSLRTGAPFTVRRQGKDYRANADVVEEDEELQQVFETVFRAAPNMARYYKVHLADGIPDSDDLARLAAEGILVRIQLEQADLTDIRA